MTSYRSKKNSNALMIKAFIFLLMLTLFSVVVYYGGKSIGKAFDSDSDDDDDGTPNVPNPPPPPPASPADPPTIGSPSTVSADNLFVRGTDYPITVSLVTDTNSPGDVQIAYHSDLGTVQSYKAGKGDYESVENKNRDSMAKVRSCFTTDGSEWHGMCPMRIENGASGPYPAMKQLRPGNGIIGMVCRSKSKKGGAHFSDDYKYMGYNEAKDASTNRASRMSGNMRDLNRGQYTDQFIESGYVCYNNNINNDNTPLQFGLKTSGIKWF